MILETTKNAPVIDNTVRTDGMIIKDGNLVPGLILSLWLQLRKQVGAIQAVRKPGMKFDTRAAEAVFNKIRPIANDLGILIYPHATDGNGHPIEDGTLASVNLTIYCQSVEDGSVIQIAGFGLGADSQDKAGGKANTYAFKSALLEALLAQGTDDTDDTDTPIRGGVKRVQSPSIKGGNSAELASIKALFESAKSPDDYAIARAKLVAMDPDSQLQLRNVAIEAKKRVGA